MLFPYFILKSLPHSIFGIQKWEFMPFKQLQAKKTFFFWDYGLRL